jgi:plasmid rolling circle replication initiator protein Rep
MTKAEHYSEIAEASYKDKNVYDAVIAIIQNRSEHGFHTLVFSECDYLKQFGNSVYEELISDLKSDGFKIYKDPSKLLHMTVIGW